jgi:hypothetical protein
VTTTASTTPEPSRIRRIVRSKVTWALTATGSVVLTAGLLAFEPWALWIDKTVVEAAPVAAAPAEPVVRPAVQAAPEPVPAAQPEAAAKAESGAESGAETESGAKTRPAAPAAPATEFTGTFISHEHSTTGTVQILRLADGSRVLRLENLDTSNGPDLKVVLSDAAVKPGKAGWHVFDDNVHVKLAGLKGNKGSQNYVIPADVDLADFRSVSIWCDRFNVSFGAAELRAQS